MPRRPQSYSLAIIGAGIGGLATAAALRHLGIAATIYEQAHRFARVGAGLQLTPNSMKVARGLGIEERLLASGFAPEVAHNRKWDTGEITYLHPMGRHTIERYGAPDLMVHRADLHCALADILPSDTIKRGKKLVGLAPRGDKIELAFADGERIQADAVIGADGVHSVVRAAILGAEKPRLTGRAVYRAVYKTSRLGEAAGDDRVKWWGPDRHMIAYKLKPDRSEIYFNASVPEPDYAVESWSAVGDLGMLRSAFSDFHPDALAVFDACPACAKWAMVERPPLPRWSEGRVIVIGDACHPMLPTMAQGAGAAMEDAVVLARCLQAADADGVAAAFQRCEANRRERTARFQHESRANVWMKQATDTGWVYGYEAWTVPLT